MKVRIKVMRSFAYLGTLEGELDQLKLPMNTPGKADDEECSKQLLAHLAAMETSANHGPLRLHVELPE